MLYRGQQLALAEFLPLEKANWITCGNALRLDWLSVCPPTSKGVKNRAEDLFETPLDQSEIDFENEGGETYICGNPPYIGDKFQTKEQKADLAATARGNKNSKAVDYVAGWFWKASEYILKEGAFAFVATNSVCQGVQVPIIWPRIFRVGQEIQFAHRSFYWSNNASHNANVICVIVGVRNKSKGLKFIFWDDQKKEAANVNAYLIDGSDVLVEKHPSPISSIPPMFAGNIPRDKGNLMFVENELSHLLGCYPEAKRLVRKILGSKELINGIERYCLWITDDQASFARSIPPILERLKRIEDYRSTGSDRGKLGLDTPHRFERTIVAFRNQLVVPRVSSERRPYLPVDLVSSEVIVSDAAQAIYDSPVYVLSIICSRMHLAWVSVTAGRMKSDFRYSSGVCYNSFPLPPLTEQNKADLTRCAEDILLAREAHFPATIADLYDPEKMPGNLRAAHERNDETLERIYIGRRFKNDTERLEKLFELYTQMTAKAPAAKKAAKKATGRTKGRES